MHMNRELAVYFEWFRCPQGYRFASAREIFQPLIDSESNRSNSKEARAEILELINSSEPYSILPNSPERVPYRPLEAQGSLFTVFARVKTPDDLLKFVNLYGPVSEPESRIGDPIDRCLDSARHFRELLSWKSRGPKKVATVFEAQLLARWLAFYQRTARNAVHKPPSKGLSLSVGSIQLIPDPARGVRLSLTTEDLLGVMLWQLALKLSGTTSFRECRQCGDLFEAGPGCKVRADSRFCCPEHSVRFHSLRRSKGA